MALGGMGLVEAAGVLARVIRWSNLYTGLRRGLG
jgi:hypothetical protein